jgi:Cu-Zn family superoxide dismutase
MYLRKLAFIAPLLLVSACGGNKPEPNAGPPPGPEPTAEPPSTEPPAGAEKPAGGEEKPAGGEEKPAPAAAGPVEVKIEGRSGSKLSGTAKLEKSDGGVKVTIDLSDAPPGVHGAHIHEKADCSAPDAKSAGDHFNPDGHKHGMPPGERHLGDLGNIEVDKKGKAHLEIEIKDANLDPGDKHSFLDKGMIIHEKKDNGGQPTGNAGGRIGCAEIKR